MKRNRSTATTLGLVATTLALLGAVWGTASAADAGPLAERPEVRDAIRVLDVWVREQVESRGLPGLSLGVVHDQELVWASGYGFQDLERRIPASPQTLYRMGSITKLFTATAVLKLRDAGLLELNDPVREHLPWFAVEKPFPGAPQVTIQHLLTHTSGLPREAPIPYWTTHEFPTFDALRQTLPSLALHSPPGAEYRYSNLGMALLGELVEAVSGKPYAAYVQDEILGPLGMGDSTIVPTEEHLTRRAVSYMRRLPDGTRRIFDYYDMEGLAAAGNLISSVTDLAKFASLQFREGEAGDGKILSAYTLREMRRPHFVYGSWGGGRGLGWGVSRDEGQTFVSHGGWIGGNRSHLLLSPDEEIAVIAITNADDASPYFFSREAYDVVGSVIAEVMAPEAAARAVDPAWARYEGLYTDPWGWEYRVMLLSDGLALYEHSYPPAEEAESSLTRLTHVEGNRFTLPDGEPVIFELDDEGRVVRIQRRFEYLHPVEEKEGVDE